MTSATLQHNPSEHIPVLAQEVLKGIAPKKNEIYVDATFGRGGYSELMLKAADCRVIGIDRDPTAVSVGKEFEKRYPHRFQMLKGNFSQMKELLAGIDVKKVHGITFDVGVSSPQLDVAERGFSFRNDGPLDMRMGDEGETAADIVNNASEKDLADIIYTYGEEHASRKIACAIVTRRQERKFARTRELAELIASVVPKRDETHPATKTFQALRIAVNDELGELEKGLAAAEKLLAPKGRLAVVTFHSLEDRIVKNYLRLHSGRLSQGSRHRPMVGIKEMATFKLIKTKPMTPSEEEMKNNPRARSAKLRLAERLGEGQDAT